MPIIYRHNLPSTSTPSRTTNSRNNIANTRQDPAPTDADDSIVLSDLVRTGEASRLRRRGAMRLDHGSAGGQPPQGGNETPAQIVVASPTWGSEPESAPESSPVFARNIERERALRYGYASGNSRGRSRSDIYEDGDEGGYTLFCGGQDAEGDVEADLEQRCSGYEPSLLPLYPPQSSARRPSYKKAKGSNGCGALLHMQASPRRRLGVWTAKSEASSGAVVGMDASYFDRAAVAKIVRSACGCVREGVGCAVCGNPLGTRYKPCKTAAEGIFSSRSHSRSSHSFHPEGPQYWHAQSNPRTRPSSSTASHPHSQHSLSHNPTSSSSPFYVYTFFSTSVLPSPAFSFPPRPALTPQSPTAPQSLSQSQPQSQSQLRYQYQPQPRQYQYQAPQAIQYIPTYRSPPSSPPPRPRQQESTSTIIAPLTINREAPRSPTSDNASTPTVAASPVIPFFPPSQLPDSPMFSAYESDNTPAINTMMFDRALTASPMPLSDVEEREGEGEAAGDAYAYRYQYQYRYRASGGEPDAYLEQEGYRFGEDGGGGAGGAVGVRFDADGEFIADPGSPDKTGEVMLFPER